MLSYAAARDLARQIYAEKRDQIANLRRGIEAGDKRSIARASELPGMERKCAGMADIGRVLSAVVDADARDPDGLAERIGRPLQPQEPSSP